VSFVHDDGTLIFGRWAAPAGELAGSPILAVDTAERSSPMYGTKATGDPLVTNGQLGVDLIRVPAGDGFAPHTHPGDHLLIVIAGKGTITYEGRIYPTGPGQVYMIEGAVPHAVGAIEDHLILAVGSPHRAIDAADRMSLVEYKAVATAFGELMCLVCDPPGRVSPKAPCQHFPMAPGDGRLLVVGRAPAAEWQAAPFVGTRSGARLAAALDTDPALLTQVVDTVNLSPSYLPDWQAVPDSRWRELGLDLLPTVGGRVVVACGRTVARALGVDPGRPWGSAQVAWGTTPPALVVLIPHPGAVDPNVAPTRRALALARTLAQTGPRSSKWDEADADSFNAAMSQFA